MSPQNTHPLDAAIAAEWAPLPSLDEARAALRPTGILTEVIRSVEVSVNPHQVLASLKSALSAAECDIRMTVPKGGHSERCNASALAEVRSAIRMIEALRVGSG